MPLYANAERYAKAHPTRDGGPWKGYCASLMYRMCEWLGKAPTKVPIDADAAATAAGVLNKEWRKAPIGAFHYWSIGEYGHVGLDLKGAGTTVFMASTHCTTKWNKAGDLGWISIPKYYTASKAKYLGWSMKYGNNGKITK